MHMGKIDEEVKGKHLLYQSGERGIEALNSWDLSAEQRKRLGNYWERFKNFVKPKTNLLITACELYNLRQGTLSPSRIIHCKVKNPFEGSQLSGRTQRAIPQGLPSAAGYEL